MSDTPDTSGTPEEPERPHGEPEPSEAETAAIDAPAAAAEAVEPSDERPPTEPLPPVAAGAAAEGAPGAPPQTGARSTPRWKAAALAVAVAASGLIGGVVGSQLDDETTAGGQYAPAPVTGGSRVALPADGFADLYKRMLPTVVQIDAPGQTSDSTGSGVIVDKDGTVVTAAHVVGDQGTVTVVLSDGRQFEGKVAGRDPQGDLAVLEIVGAPDDLEAAPFGDSDQLAVGHTTAALGAPFGLRNSLTVGVVSGLNRTFQPNPGAPPLRGLIQTDAAINPGSSGGPLFDAAGRVIGINTAIKSPVGGSVGVGFAVPVNQVRDSIPLLSEGKTIERAFLGIEGKAGGKGVDVVNVTGGSSADGAGIRTGDVIVSVDGHKVLTVDDIAAQLTKHKVGDRIEVTIQRSGEEKKVEVELKPLPASSS
jgi:putative serine protease PepD